MFEDTSSLVALFKSVISADWKSSELPDKNAFTTSMVVRAAGFMVRADVLKATDAADLKHLDKTSKEESLQKIIQDKANFIAFA